MEDNTKPAPRFATIEEKLKAMREGYKFSHSLQYGGFPFEVRILSADEEAKIYASARAHVAKLPGITEDERDGLKPLENMKAILMAAATIGSDQHLPRSLLNQLSTAEIQALYESYLDICCEVDPKFTSLSQNEINEIIAEVKKSPEAVNGLSTRQLKGIGKSFLEDFLPMVNKLGGS
jgi:hypothetical protein